MEIEKSKRKKIIIIYRDAWQVDILTHTHSGVESYIMFATVHVLMLDIPFLRSDREEIFGNKNV